MSGNSNLRFANRLLYIIVRKRGACTHGTDRQTDADLILKYTIILRSCHGVIRAISRAFGSGKTGKMTTAGIFIFNSILFGIALAMDAFSVSIAYGLKDPQRKLPGALKAPVVFAFFQIIMPLAGWFCVRRLVTVFTVLQKFLPWIAFAVLIWLGIGMIREGLSSEKEESGGSGNLFIQGIATSLDALSVGFTIAEYTVLEALAECCIIGVVTFAICAGGIFIGQKAGEKLGQKAPILGGAILIAIGIEILLKGIL